MRHLLGKLSPTAGIAFVVMVSLLLGVGPFVVSHVLGDPLSYREVRIADNRPNVVTSYKAGIGIATPGTVGSVMVEFCSNTALFDDPCDAPAGFDISAASLVDQTGETGFSIDMAHTTQNVLVLTRTPAAAAAGQSLFTLDNVHNPSALGGFFARLSTFQTTDATGPSTDKGSVALVIDKRFAVNTEVPPMLQVCLGVTVPNDNCSEVDGDYVNLGELSGSKTATAQTQIVVATNASNGYTVRVDGLTMNSGNNAITALTTPTANAPGNSQFGINLRANSSPAIGREPSGPGSGTYAAKYSQPNLYVYKAGDVIAQVGHSDDFRRYTVSYIVNVNRDQPPGVYSSTFTYIALGNF